jgi:hypothetical protein
MLKGAPFLKNQDNNPKLWIIAHSATVGGQVASPTAVPKPGLK